MEHLKNRRDKLMSSHEQAHSGESLKGLRREMKVMHGSVCGSIVHAH